MAASSEPGPELLVFTTSNVVIVDPESTMSSVAVPGRVTVAPPAGWLKASSTVSGLSVRSGLTRTGTSMSATTVLGGNVRVPETARVILAGDGRAAQRRVIDRDGETQLARAIDRDHGRAADVRRCVDIDHERARAETDAHRLRRARRCKG